MTAVSCFIARDFFIRIRPYQFPFLKNILGAFSRYPFQLRASTPFSQAQHSKKNFNHFSSRSLPLAGFPLLSRALLQKPNLVRKSIRTTAVAHTFGIAEKVEQ